MSPLPAFGGHRSHVTGCPLLGAQRTSKMPAVMSANDPKRTWPEWKFGPPARRRNK